MPVIPEQLNVTDFWLGSEIAVKVRNHQSPVTFDRNQQSSSVEYASLRAHSRKPVSSRNRRERHCTEHLGIFGRRS